MRYSIWLVAALALVASISGCIVQADLAPGGVPIHITAQNARATSAGAPALTLPAGVAGLRGGVVDTSHWAKSFPFGKRTGATPGELEYYLDANVQASPGMTRLVAKHTGSNGKLYTSGMICSYPLETWRYGYFEASVLLPSTQGVWPAVWLRGTGSSPYWEVDLLEAVNKCNVCYQTVHYSDRLTGIIQHVRVASVKIGPGWHTVGAYLEPDCTTLYVDGRETGHVDVGAPVASYLICNLAVGGSWPGAPSNVVPFGTPTVDVGAVGVWQ